VRSILGINCFSHDTAACLLVDGVPVAIAEEERFDRNRHTRAFPDQAIESCLSMAGITMREVDAVAVAQHPATDFARGAADAIRRGAPKRLAVQAYVDGRLVGKELDFRRRWRYRGRLIHVGHHKAHAASTYFASPFDDAAVLTLDRGGDFLSTTMAVGQGNRLRTIAEIGNPHSLGEVYSALTWFLGFQPNADEGKTMGLAPYGTDRFGPDIARLIRLRADGSFRVNLRWFSYQREGRPLSRHFYRRYGEPRVPESELTDRDKDLAWAVQNLIEDAGLHVARAARRLTGSTRLCLAGGVALNGVMNTRLLEDAGFEEIFVQPASSDAGNALGAALWVWHELEGRPRTWDMRHAYLGVGWGDDAVVEALRAASLPHRRVADPAATAAGILAQGKVVGWFQGRAEIGPRALGARSILADPRPADMRDRVNAQVKRREWFRPFAPSVLHERGADYFDGYHESPFMLLVLPIRVDKRDVIPAVAHVDGTGRLQSVRPDSSPEFYRLISEFDRLTGVPVVLNTSLNLRGEPIVHRPKEAIADFVNSEMDALVIGSFVTEKPEAAAPA
jgi:carbamoyltransferase